MPARPLTLATLSPPPPPCWQFVLKAGDAKLLVRGSLLGERQDASVLLTDFPISTLRPIFRCQGGGGRAGSWQWQACLDGCSSC